jgi:hypothetical protein
MDIRSPLVAHRESAVPRQRSGCARTWVLSARGVAGVFSPPRDATLDPATAQNSRRSSRSEAISNAYGPEEPRVPAMCFRLLPRRHCSKGRGFTFLDPGPSRLRDASPYCWLAQSTTTTNPASAAAAL